MTNKLHSLTPGAPDRPRQKGQAQKGSPCGTRSSYNAGCHCDDCREANRVYIEQRRRSAGVQPLKVGPQTPHGTSTRYSRGCRCEKCRVAETEYMRARRNSPNPWDEERRAAMARGRWPQYHGKGQ